MDFNERAELFLRLQKQSMQEPKPPTVFKGGDSIPPSKAESDEAKRRGDIPQWKRIG